MGSLLRWLGGGSNSVNMKKRGFVDMAGTDENPDQIPAVNKRVKRAFVNISQHDDEDNIIVQHRPLGELNIQQLANRLNELSEDQFVKGVQRKLYVKPATLAPEFVAEYSDASSAKKPVRAARNPTQEASQSFPPARTPKPPSKLRARPAAATTSVRAVKNPMKASSYADLRSMFGLSALTSPHRPKDSMSSSSGTISEGSTPVQHVLPSAVHASGSSQRRSARAAAKTYADLAESEDEFAPASTNRMGVRRPKPKDDDDDDFIEDERHVSETDDEAELAHDLGESSSDAGFQGEEDEEDLDDDAPHARPTKRSQMKVKAKVDNDDDGQPKVKSKKSRLRMVNLKSGNVEAKKINHSLPPLFEIEDIFHDITTKALKFGLSKAVKGLNARPIRVATMCSGTESPLLALEMIQDCLQKIEPSLTLQIEHLFSAEIVPFKQAYIERNFNPPVIFRDITELTSVVDDEEPMATTAYGGKAPVPKAVDMVIAGTSCVDFSGLNSHQKDLDDGGESADTWNAVLSYCRAFRPAIVLLENVSGADWDRMLSDYEDINYECSGAMVNTRDYYIPQVRERGYMACFKKDSAGYAPKSADKWVGLMEKFKRPASSPVSDFLIPNDEIVQRLIRNDEPTREFDWKQCEITQMEYRQDMRLGWARPVTYWSESGWMLPPDNGHASWYHKQVERVLDTIDGAVLRKALEMFDCRFKTRIFDLSQNIYRETDHRPFGIAGCITPSGIYFVTDLGRVLTSEETLKLQGIPLAKISFTTEQQSEIQSLAGNAMSSTVIAASILSALIPGHTAIDTQHRDPPGPKLALLHKQRKLITDSSAEHVRASLSNGSFDMDELLQKAAMATRRCYCEGPSGLSERPIQQCRDCGHTTCTSCGGNPAHRYRQDKAMSEGRMQPAEFKDYIRSVMPLQVAFSSLQLSQFSKLWPSVSFKEAAIAALNGSFALSSIRRTHCWTVSYRGEGSRLELTISPDHAQWCLYATPNRDLPGDSWLRRTLAQPIARSIALGRSSTLDAVGWSLRMPKSKPEAMPLTVTGSGPKVASWWSRMEMPDFTHHVVPSILDIQVQGTSNVAAMISGKYQYLPNCGKACNSLYRKGDNGMFLFLDPTRTGEPRDDCFVFSNSIALLEKDENRQIIARITPSWRPWSTDGAPERPAQVSTELLVDESWHKLPSCCLSAREMELAITRLQPADMSMRCSDLAMLLTCNIPQNTAMVSSEQRIVQAEDGNFFQSHAWVFEAIRRYIPQCSWHQFHDHDREGTCESCAPARPALRWGLSEDGKELRPYEDPRAAALFERTMKSRLSPIQVAVEPVDGGSTFSICLDIATLAHRAGARLPKDLDVSYQWRFATAAQTEFKFKPFKLHDTRGVYPYAKDLHMSIKLFPQQLMSLAWMKKQEEGVPFDIEEGEEALIHSLGWKAEVRATATKTIRGGICADHPGFGKTITSLALIHSEFSDSTAATMQADLQSRAHGYLAHAGTLIVCPASLIDQWVSEIHDKIKYGSRSLCVLKAAADLSKYTISDFKDFKIVLVNRSLLSNDTYIERLATFAGIPGPVSNKGRLFTQWLAFAHQQFPAHLKLLVEGGMKEFKAHIENVYRERVHSDEFKATVPSKRLTGANYVAGKEKKVKSTANAKAHARTAIPTAQLGKPLLEMFYWNRIIVDEFHQPEARIGNVVIAAMQADKRWGLSATPAISDFYEVSRMAALIGVPLRVGSDKLGIMKSASVKELRKDMTNFELFDAMRQIPSDSMHSRIHENDQQFMDKFVRQNIMDHKDLPFQDHLVPVSLDIDHRALYAELSQHLNSAEMRIKKKTKATDRDKRFNEAVSTSLSAEEALSKVAAFSDRGNETGYSSTLDLTAIVRSRQSAVESILHKLPIAFAEAKGTEEAFERWVKSRLEEGTLGDAETCEELLNVVKVKGIKVSAAELKRRAKTGEYGLGKRALTAYLNGLCNRLLIEKRSARYMQSLHDLQQAAQKGNLDVTCDNPSCATQVQSLDAAISALCGHTICRTCYERRQESESMLCPCDGCSSSMSNHHLFWPNKVGDLFTATPYGAKIDAAVRLLDKIRDKNEQAILFVQYSNQLDEVEMALTHCGISAVVVKAAEKAGLQIQNFRETAGTKQQKTVIVLNSSDETAAGSNLQNANHVIFLSPLLKDTQYGYDSTMAQTIGRVRRHGQEKKIHIYRIMALDTVDVDFLEHRERRCDALVEQGAPEIERPAEVANKTTKERTQLVKEDQSFSLRPQSWLVTLGLGSDREQAGHDDARRVKGRHRVLGWEDFSSLVKFSKNFTEDDD